MPRARPHRLLLRLLTAALPLLVAAPAHAHDFWIEAADFRPAPGSTVPLALRVGTVFPGDPVPHMTAWIARFELIGPQGTGPVRGIDGRIPAGFARLAGPGGYAVVYRSEPTAIELPAAEFEAYLAQEGLERVSEARAARNATGRPGRERFSRSVKTLLATAGADAAADLSVHTRPTGLPLELMPSVSPYAVPATGRLAVTLLWHGAPLAGALVEAERREAPGAVQRARTDSRGRAVFDVSAPGMWRLTTVEMVPAEPGSGADWRSVWTSLTFLRGPGEA